MRNKLEKKARRWDEYGQEVGLGYLYPIANSSKGTGWLF
jgi:hypothetical protein